MLYPKIEDCITKAAGSKYTLVSIVAKRAKDLATRAPGQFQSGKEKEISYAMREVIDGRMTPLFTATQTANHK